VNRRRFAPSTSSGSGTPKSQPTKRGQFLTGADGKLSFKDTVSEATLVDYLCAVQSLVQRRRVPIDALEAAVPESSHSQTVARLRCFRGIDTLTAAGLCAEVGDFTCFAKPTLLSGFLGVVPSEYTSNDKRVQGQIIKPDRRTPDDYWSRPPTTVTSQRCA
jgi:transposase